MARSKPEKLTLEEKIHLASFRAVKELESEPSISREKLYAKIERAARQAGIYDVVVVPMDPNQMGSRFTHGFARPRKYLKKDHCQDSRHDLGYVELDLHTRTITRRSISINYDAFSDERGEKFRQALLAQGLKPQAYHPSCAPIFYTKEDLAWEKVRNQRAAYQ